MLIRILQTKLQLTNSKRKSLTDAGFLRLIPMSIFERYTQTDNNVLANMYLFTIT